MSADISDLLKEVEARRLAGTTWVDELEGDALEFVEAVKARIEAGSAINTAAVTRILRREFGVEVGETTVRRWARRLRDEA